LASNIIKPEIQEMPMERTWRQFLGRTHSVTKDKPINVGSSGRIFRWTLTQKSSKCQIITEKLNLYLGEPPTSTELIKVPKGPLPSQSCSEVLVYSCHTSGSWTTVLCCSHKNKTHFPPTPEEIWGFK
jgi:hypothetical protein